MFSLRNKKNYLGILLNTLSYLELWFNLLLKNGMGKNIVSYSSVLIGNYTCHHYCLQIVSQNVVISFCSFDLRCIDTPPSFSCFHSKRDNSPDFLLASLNEEVFFSSPV